jgi:hypothetical protein
MTQEEVLHDIIGRLQNEVHDLASYIRQLEIAVWHVRTDNRVCLGDDCHMCQLYVEVANSINKERLA